ncbi:hypothetical protein BH09PSE3_BH09PSE3_23210 [soil metagenome]
MHRRRRAGMGSPKITIPLEDDGMVAERELEWLHPSNSRVLLLNDLTACVAIGQLQSIVRRKKICKYP